MFNRWKYYFYHYIPYVLEQIQLINFFHAYTLSHVITTSKYIIFLENIIQNYYWSNTFLIDVINFVYCRMPMIHTQIPEL